MTSSASIICSFPFLDFFLFLHLCLSLFCLFPKEIHATVSLAFFVCSSTVFASSFLNEPKTGLQLFLGNDTPAEVSGTLISLDDIVTIPDFDLAAKSYLPSINYSYYRTGEAGEYSMYLPHIRLWVSGGVIAASSVLFAYRPICSVSSESRNFQQIRITPSRLSRYR